MALDIGGTDSNAAILNLEGVQQIAQRVPLQSSIGGGTSIDIGFSASEFLSNGGEALLERALRKLPVPSGWSGKVVQALKQRLDIVKKFADDNNLNVNDLAKIEIDFPGNPFEWGSAEAWTQQTTLHIKTAPGVFTSIGREKQLYLLMTVGGMTRTSAEAALSGINFAGTQVNDVRLILSPTSGLSGGDWEPRFGVIKAWDGVKGRTRDALGGSFQRGPLGFISPRLWPDGTFQIIAGVAVDVTEKPASGKTSVFGDKTFVEYAGFVNLKFKRGDLIKLNDGSYGVKGKFNGQNAIVRLPDAVISDIPEGFKSASLPQSSVTETIIVDFDRVAIEQVDSALDPRVVDAGKTVIKAGGPVFQVLQTLAESVDAATDVGGALQAIGDEAVKIGQAWAREFDLIGFNGLNGPIGTSVGGYLDKNSHGPMADKVWSRKGNLNNTDFVKTVIAQFQGGNGAAGGAVLRELILKGNLSVNDVYSVLIPYSQLPQTEILPGILTSSYTPWEKERANKILSDGFFGALTQTRDAVGEVRVSKILDRANAREVRAIVKSAVDNGADPYSIAIQAFALWQKADAIEGKNLSNDKNALLYALIDDPRVSAADAIITGIFSAYDFGNRKDGKIGMAFGGAEISQWVAGRKFDPKAYIVELGNQASKALDAGNDSWITVKSSDGSSLQMPSKLAARYDRIAYFMLKEGLDYNFGIPLLETRINNLKAGINGGVVSIYDPSVLKNIGQLRTQYQGGWKPNAQKDQIIESLLGNKKVLQASLVDLLPVTADLDGGAYVISNTRPMPGISYEQLAIDEKATSDLNSIVSSTSLSNEQKLIAATELLANPAISAEKKAELQALLDNGIKKQITEAGNLAKLRTEIGEAKRIATESGNQLGLLLATVAEGVVNSLYAKVDPTTVNLPFAGNVNAVAAAATAAGLTFSQFVQLIGRGDLAAFGAVIGDVGEVFKQSNLGNTGSTIGAGFELVGNSLTAIGRQKGDKGLIIAGTAVNGVGGVIKASQSTVPGAATNAGFKLAGNLATTIGQLGNSSELQALGIGLNAAADIPKLFGDGKYGNGSAAISEAASQIVGLLVGGEAGRIIAGVGSLVSTGFQIAGNTVPGGAGGLYVTAARQLLSIVGVKLDAATNFALGTLSTALVGGPVGWAIWGVGFLFNLFSMGSFSKTALLADNIDADGDGKTDDLASLRQDFRRGFFGNVRQTGHQILYDVNGVDVRLLQNSQMSLTPEVINLPIRVSSGRGGTSFSAQINGQWVSGSLVDGRGRALDSQGRVPGNRGSSNPVGGVFFQVQNMSAIANPWLANRPELAALSGQRFAASAEGDYDSGTSWSLNQPTGNFVLKIDATYGAINPSTAAINASKTWVLNPADAAVWRNYMGGDTANIGPNDPRAAAGNYLANALDQMTAQYQGQKNDPNLYMYLDMNGDGIADRIRVGLQTDGLKVKGDGKVQVWILNAARQETGVSFLANNFAEAEEIGQMSGQVLGWGAGRPDLWSQGKDLGSLYVQARNSGALALMKEANTLTSDTIAALFGGQNSNLEAAFARLDQINQALASPFNAAEYMEVNPDVGTAMGGDPAKAAQHYIQYGNSEGRAVNKAGLVLAKSVIRSSFENGVLRTNETLISQNGQYFAIFQGDGNLVVYRGSPAMPGQAMWSSGTQNKAAGGFAVMQADGNLVVYDAAGRAQWASGTNGGGVNRPFTLAMQDDGNLVVYDAKQGGEALWSSMGGRIGRAEENVKPAAGWSDATALAYLASHQDLINAFGADANQARNHYNMSGVNEGRQITFDAAAYMAANPDVATWAGGDPAKAAQHYIGWGVFEGRTPAAGQAARTVPLDQRMDKLPWMALSYLASYPDLMNAFGQNAASAGQHYRQSGAAEGRQINFNPWSYMAANPDVAAWAGNDAMKAFDHFFAAGRYEPRAIVQGGAVRTPDARPPTGIERAGQTWLAGYTNVGQSLVNGVLRTGQFMASANGLFVTVMQTDGNLVVYRLNSDGTMNKAIWASGTNGKANGGFAVMQADGNFVVYDAANKPRWDAGSWTSGVNRPFTLVMQDDGNLVVYDTQGGEALWSNYTGRIARPEANAA